MTAIPPQHDQHPEDTGLNLFDDRASAAGSFPHAMLGYDRQEVDRYVREIEQQVSTLKQLTRHLRREVTSAQTAAGTTDFTRLGAHATGLLRSAEAQSSDLVSKAGLEAERIKEEGRRVAADLRANAQAEADDIRVAGLSNLRKLRADLDADVQATQTRARTEAGSIVEAAQRQAESSLNEAKSNASSIIEAAKVEADRIRQQAERDAAAVTLEARTRAEETMKKAQSDHGEAKERAAAMMADARRHHEQSTERLAADTAAAAKLRSDAQTEGEQVKIAAAREAEAQIGAAHRQAAMMKDRLEEQFNWRKEQLEREVATLLQRKASVIAQLSNIRALAGESAIEFPDLDPFATTEEAPKAEEPAQPAGVDSVSDMETTVIRPAAQEDPHAAEEITTSVDHELTTVIGDNAPEQSSESDKN